MNDLPRDLYYTNEHEWLRKEEDGSITVGITDYAQAALGDLVYVEIPEIGQNIDAGGEMAVVESVKAASDVYSPLSGKITNVNEILANEPQIINLDPYGEGWIACIFPSDEINNVMNADEYQQFLDDLEE
jgi:glycine cleavage system H protein